jgi:hypothetical protein
MKKKTYDYEGIKNIAEEQGVLFLGDFVFSLYRRYFVVKNGSIIFDHAKKSKCFEYLELTA